MNNEKMGQFIAELRKNGQMTQRELAEKLNITDKAVSKWERGLSCPDISLLSSLADILGVTTGELLNGERSNADAGETQRSVDNVLQYADKAVKCETRSIQNICAAAFSALLLLGIIVCAICDLAISRGFTWSLFPISSIVFAWFILFPIIKWGKKGIVGALIAVSLLTIPFLYVMNYLIPESDLILPIGIRSAVISAAYLWIVFALFCVLKTRRLAAAALSLLLAIPVYILINLSLAGILFEPVIDLWDILSFSALGLLAGILFVIDYMSAKNDGTQRKKSVVLAGTAAGMILLITGMIGKTKDAMAVSVIGGADGPTAVFVAGKSGGSFMTVMILAGCLLILTSIVFLLKKR